MNRSTTTTDELKPVFQFVFGSLNDLMEVTTSPPLSISLSHPPLTPSPNSLENKKWTSKKQYNLKWESDPLLKTWISRHPHDVGKVVCRYCQSIIRAHKNDLLEHTRTLKHQRNFMENSSPEEYNSFVMELNELRKEAHALTRKRISNSNNNNLGLKNNNSNSNNNNNNNDITITSGSGGIQQKSTVVMSLATNGVGAGDSNQQITDIINWEKAKLTLSGSGTGNIGNNTNGQNGICDVLEGDDSIWQESEGFMTSSPSDLVSVILETEEHQSPNSSSNSGTNTSSGQELNNTIPMPVAHRHQNNNAQAHFQNQNNIDVDNGNNNSNTSSTNSSCINNSLSSSTLNSTSNISISTVDSDNRTVNGQYHIKQIISAIENNNFSLPQLCTLVKAAFKHIEQSLTTTNSSTIDTRTTTSKNQANSSSSPDISISLSSNTTSNNHSVLSTSTSSSSSSNHSNGLALVGRNQIQVHSSSNSTFSPTMTLTRPRKRKALSNSGSTINSGEICEFAQKDTAIQLR